MKKTISLTSLLVVSTAALSPVLMIQNMSHQKLSYGYTPPPAPSGFKLISKFDFNKDVSKI